METYDWFMVPSLIIVDFLISETQQSIIVNCFSTIHMKANTGIHCPATIQIFG